MPGHACPLILIAVTRHRWSEGLVRGGTPGHAHTP
jgi:hypothetical protein